MHCHVHESDTSCGGSAESDPRQDRIKVNKPLYRVQPKSLWCIQVPLHFVTTASSILFACPLADAVGCRILYRIIGHRNIRT